MKPEQNLYGVEDIVSELQTRGYDINDMEFLSWLRRHGYLVGEKGDCYNAPSSACRELGWMVYQRTIAQGAGGRIHIELRPMFTDKGSNILMPKIIRYLMDRDEGKNVFD